jgi:competence protein ComEC
VAAGAAALAPALPRRARAPLAVLVALGAGAGGLAARLEDAARGAGAAPRELVIEGRVRAVERGAAGWRVLLEQVSGVGDLAPPRVELRGEPTPAGVPSFEAALPGERVRARVRLREPLGLRNPGLPDPEARARRTGLGAVGRLAHPALHARLPERDAAAPALALQRLRARLAARLGAAGPGGALLRALALGEAGELSRQARDAFAALGIAHLLSVSGLHLALAASLFYAGARLALARCTRLAARADLRGAALALGVAAAAGYALLAGFGVPVRRALLMLGAYALGVAAGRGRARAEALCLASLAILASEPEALFAAGAQLSFAATAGLLFAARAPARGGRVAELLRTSATAFAATAPLAAQALGNSAPLSLAANALAVPWTGAVLLPAALAAAGAAAVPGAAADALIAAAERLAAWSLAAVAEAARHAPGAASGAAPALPWLALAAGLGAAALAARATRARVAWAVALGLALHAAPPAPLAPAGPRAVFLDVGQGDAALVQGRAGALLVDAGSALPGGLDLGRSAVVPALRALGVARLDLAAASHADLDHRGGLPAVLAALPVGELWLPRGAAGDPAFAELRAAAGARGVPVRERGAGDPPARFGDLEVLPLWPPAGELPLSQNDRSLVLRVAVAGRRVLLPGDLESAGEAALLASGADLRADVLKLPHHGSRSSSGTAFLAAVGAGLAVASAPCAGRFGMPHAEVLARARAAALSLWWTGRDGAVSVQLAAATGSGAGGAARRGLAVRGQGARRRCPRRMRLPLPRRPGRERRRRRAMSDAAAGVSLTRFAGARGEARDDEVAREEPLEIRLEGASLAVVMRTPGDDAELALGFLVTERVIDSPAQVLAVRHWRMSQEPEAAENVIEVRLAPGVKVDLERLRRNLYASSSCGICGKATIENALASAPPLADPARFSAGWFYDLPQRLAARQDAFARTGGLHAAGLFAPDGELVAVREDVGRHNAVDKVVGFALRAGRLPLAGHVLLVSGRISYEIVQKALAARVPVLAAVSAPSSLAVEFAARAGIALVGFLRGSGLNVYGSRERVVG